MPASLPLTKRLQVGLWRAVMAGLGAAAGQAVPRSRVTEHRYGPHPLERLDEWAVRPGVRAKTAVVHLHGGGWLCGSKGRFYTKPLSVLADAGHPVFSLNYPLAPEAPNPEQVRALLRGLAYIKRSHPQITQVHLIGDSAGGNLAMMLAILISNPGLLQTFDPINPDLLPHIQSVASLYGVLDRLTWLEDGFPGAKLFLTSYAGAGALQQVHTTPYPVTPMDLPAFAILPPTFIAAASKDRLARSSKVAYDHLRQTFADITYKLYPGADHGFYNFGPQSRELSQDLLVFLDRS